MKYRIFWICLWCFFLSFVSSPVFSPVFSLLNFAEGALLPPSQSKNFKQKADLLKAQKLWKELAVQHRGRIKPFDTFARESLREICGKEACKGRAAVDLLLSWFFLPHYWEKAPFILIEEKEVKQSLGLPLKEKHFSPHQLKNSPSLSLQLEELRALRQQEESELDPYFKRLSRLDDRLRLYAAIRSGLVFGMEAQQAQEGGQQEQQENWLSFAEMSKPARDQFVKLLSVYIRLISKTVVEGKEEPLPSNKTAFTLQPSDPSPLTEQEKKQAERQAERQKAKQEYAEDSSPTTLLTKADEKDLLLSFQKEMEIFKSLAHRGPAKKQAQSFKIKAEVFYNSFKPFQKGWILYFLALFSLSVLFILGKGKNKGESLGLLLSMPFALLGFGSHSLGLVLRSYIMSRPPVSNMYETVVWVPWASLIAGFVFFLKGQRLPFLASWLLAFFCLLLTDLAPGILDSDLNPLEAVLRSNFWLATHVLIITVSYSFFFLAFVLGDMALVAWLVRKGKDMGFIHKMSHPIYRCMQWGVVCLAAGTILGGIWADYSWGRFWGWDPKESWALISLLSYLALLHGKLIGWIKPFGMAVGAVGMFFSVIMAWYGVNFVLGKGLHSYGFGSGGIEVVAGFLALHVLLCSLAFLKKIQD